MKYATCNVLPTALSAHVEAGSARPQRLPLNTSMCDLDKSKLLCLRYSEYCSSLGKFCSPHAVTSFYFDTAVLALSINCTASLI